MHATLIGPEDAARHLDDPAWIFVDCRFSIREPERMEGEYRRSHIPGAVYAHLDRDLSGPVVKGRTGRHPLPALDRLAATLSSWGVSPARQVVAYDESSGAMAAARLWWLLKWAGHDAVAVLDGGLQWWQAAGRPCSAQPAAARTGRFVPRPRPELAVDAQQVLAVLGDAAYGVLDVRAAERYRGENETIDPVAGHIRGARSAPYTDNLAEDGRFKPAGELRERLDRLAGGRDAGHTVFYCGSGVTAAHAVLAFAHAGKGMARLYPGSWSEWITDPRRPIER